MTLILQLYPLFSIRFKRGGRNGGRANRGWKKNRERVSNRGRGEGRGWKEIRKRRRRRRGEEGEEGVGSPRAPELIF